MPKGIDESRLTFLTAVGFFYDKLAPCVWSTVADPGFPRGVGANSPGGRQHTNLPNFPKNCMKLKEFGPPGGARIPRAPPLDPPLVNDQGT